MNVLEMRTNKFGNSNSINGFDARFWETSNYKPNTTYAMTLTEMPDGYRLATDEDKKKNKPEDYMCYNIDARFFIRGDITKSSEWVDGAIYLVPDENKKEI